MARPFLSHTKTFISILCSLGTILLIQEAYGKTNDAEAPMVMFYRSPGKPPIRIWVEVPKTPKEFEQGLMFRKSLLKDHGMLFIFQTPRILRFWMRNTYLSLDMIFLNEQMRVVGIQENTTPLDETPLGPDEPAKYVVEVMAGFAQEHEIRVGTQAKFVHGKEIPLLRSTPR